MLDTLRHFRYKACTLRLSVTPTPAKAGFLMPVASPKPCTYPGCGALVHGGSRCARHQHIEQRVADKQRASASQRGYGSRWQKARATFLSNNRECCRCQADATVVDHKIPHKGNQELFWDSDNWQPMCKRCHDAKTARQDGGFGNQGG